MEALPMVEKPAIQIARELYSKWGPVGTTFNRELAEYVENANVWVRPDLFMMAKIIDLEGEPGWYIRMAVGSLSELLRSLPIYFPKICFQRHGDTRLRTYSLKRIARYIMAQEKKEK